MKRNRYQQATNLYVVYTIVYRQDLEKAPRRRITHVVYNHNMYNIYR